MKILVAVKPVADPYMRVRVKADGTGLEDSNVKIVINPFDEIAIEEAVRIKESAPAGEHTLTLVSIGANNCQEVLRLGLALGADEATHVISEQPLFPLDVAKILQAVVLRMRPDLVLVGKQAVDNDNNQTGQMLAGLLGWPQGTFASKIQIDKNHILMTREIDGGLETLELNLPAVITTDLRLNTPRYANLANLMKARLKIIQSCSLSELGVSVGESAIKILSMRAPEKRQPGIKVASVEELVEKLKTEKKDFLMKILVVAEHDNYDLKSASYSVVTAAKAMAEQTEIVVLVAGFSCQSVAQQAAAMNGVSHVWLVDDAVYAHPLAENLALLIQDIAKEFSAILAPATTFGKDIMPRVAALLNVPQISDITKIISVDTYERPIYAGNAIVQIQVDVPIKIITVRPSAFVACDKKMECAPIQKVDKIFPATNTRYIKSELSRSERPELASAQVVIAGGRGLQNAENFKLIESLADKLGGAIGASRAAVDAGFISNDYQVGQTGKVVAPDLYIAVGISGAVQHLAGMKDSKVIVAINKDPDAPIFQVADYGLVGDLFVILPALEAEIDKQGIGKK